MGEPKLPRLPELRGPDGEVWSPVNQPSVTSLDLSADNKVGISQGYCQCYFHEENQFMSQHVQEFTSINPVEPHPDISLTKTTAKNVFNYLFLHLQESNDIPTPSTHTHTHTLNTDIIYF